MNPTEFAFLAVGLLLGVGVGSAVVEMLRARPAPRREVRLIVAPNSIAPRSRSTLASTERLAARVPAPGGPAGDLDLSEPHVPRRSPATVTDAPGVTAIAPSPGRTPVPSGPHGGGSPVPHGHPAGGSMVVAEHPAAVALTLGRASGTGPAVASPAGAPAATAVATVERPGIADAVLPSLPPATAEVGAPADTSTIRVRPGSAGARPPVVLPADAVAIPIHVVASAGSDGEGGAAPAEGTSTGGPTSPGPGPAAADAGPCASERRTAAERCEVADRARAQAGAAAEVLQAARRAYDVLRQRVDQEERLSDPRELRAAKDAAHRAFREARAAARTPEDAEAAARDWLAEINRLNTAARAAAEALGADRDALRSALPRLEQLSVEADAARIAAETADAGCREAREALAACEEAALALPSAAEPEPEPPPPPGWPLEPDAAAFAPPAPSEPARVIRVLRGDRAAREELVAQVAGPDHEEARRWRLAFADLVDAIVARAIEDGYLEVDSTNPFWAMFDPGEQRDIVTALSALGFRFDGMGGFADDRVPAQRDLSLAVGYAGLDRMRVRTWPRESELAALFVNATVAADTWLAAQAGDLTLGRMIDALGNRAGDLADVWNAWGRIRPVLLATD